MHTKRRDSVDQQTNLYQEYIFPNREIILMIAGLAIGIIGYIAGSRYASISKAIQNASIAIGATLFLCGLCWKIMNYASEEHEAEESEKETVDKSDEEDLIPLSEDKPESEHAPPLQPPAELTESTDTALIKDSLSVQSLWKAIRGKDYGAVIELLKEYDKRFFQDPSPGFDFFKKINIMHQIADRSFKESSKELESLRKRQGERQQRSAKEKARLGKFLGRISDMIYDQRRSPSDGDRLHQDGFRSSPSSAPPSTPPASTPPDPNINQKLDAELARIIQEEDDRKAHDLIIDFSRKYTGDFFQSPHPGFDFFTKADKRYRDMTQHDESVKPSKSLTEIHHEKASLERILRVICNKLEISFDSRDTLLEPQVMPISFHVSDREKQFDRDTERAKEMSLRETSLGTQAYSLPEIDWKTVTEAELADIIRTEKKNDTYRHWIEKFGYQLKLWATDAGYYDYPHKAPGWLSLKDLEKIREPLAKDREKIREPLAMVLTPPKGPSNFPENLDWTRMTKEDCREMMARLRNNREFNDYFPWLLKIGEEFKNWAERNNFIQLDWVQTVYFEYAQERERSKSSSSSRSSNSTQSSSSSRGSGTLSQQSSAPTHPSSAPSVRAATTTTPSPTSSSSTGPGTPSQQSSAPTHPSSAPSVRATTTITPTASPDPSYSTSSTPAGILT